MIVVAKLLVLRKYYDHCKKCEVLRFHEKTLTKLNISAKLKIALLQKY